MCIRVYHELRGIVASMVTSRGNNRVSTLVFLALRSAIRSPFSTVRDAREGFFASLPPRPFGVRRIRARDTDASDAKTNRQRRSRTRNPSIAQLFNYLRAYRRGFLDPINSIVADDARAPESSNDDDALRNDEPITRHLCARIALLHAVVVTI